MGLWTFVNLKYLIESVIFRRSDWPSSEALFDPGHGRVSSLPRQRAQLQLVRIRRVLVDEHQRMVRNDS